MPGRTLRRLAIAEAATLIALLFVAVPLKHLAGLPESTRLMGALHGLIFLAFCWAVVRARAEGLLNGKDMVRLVVGACIPFGGIVNERWLRSRAMG